MRIRIIWVGKTKDAHLRALCDEYFKRLSHFVRCEVTEVRDAGGGAEKTGIDKESKRISDAFRDGAVKVLLDRGGMAWTSEELADQVRAWNIEGTKEVTFIIGGALGVSAELTGQIEKRWSLSKLTFTHEMARVLLLEQLYPAYSIVSGLTYQK